MKGIGVFPDDGTTERDDSDAALPRRSRPREDGPERGCIPVEVRVQVYHAAMTQEGLRKLGEVLPTEDEVLHVAGRGEQLVALQREMTLREKRASRIVEQPQASDPADKEAAREQSAKMDRLKAMLQERGEERVTLRREVEKLHREVETLRIASGTMAAGAADEAEEAGEQVEVSGHEPVRLNEFPVVPRGTGEVFSTGGPGGNATPWTHRLRRADGVHGTNEAARLRERPAPARGG